MYYAAVIRNLICHLIAACELSTCVWYSLLIWKLVFVTMKTGIEFYKIMHFFSPHKNDVEVNKHDYYMKIILCSRLNALACTVSTMLQRRLPSLQRQIFLFTVQYKNSYKLRHVQERYLYRVMKEWDKSRHYVQNGIGYVRLWCRFYFYEMP